MKKVFLILFISLMMILLFTSISSAQGWAINFAGGTDILVLKPEESEWGPTFYSIYLTLYSLFEGGGFGFQFGILPPYDFQYHLAYYREFKVTDRIAPGFIVTGGFGYSNGKPGFGAKIGGHVSIILAEDVRIGAQFFIAYAFGKYYEGIDPDIVIERKNILHIPINVFLMWGF